jgi:GTP-sensing pleiotropic transcriptional regulator CodY
MEESYRRAFETSIDRGGCTARTAISKPPSFFVSFLTVSDIETTENILPDIRMGQMVGTDLHTADHVGRRFSVSFHTLGKMEGIQRAQSRRLGKTAVE